MTRALCQASEKLAISQLGDPASQQPVAGNQPSEKMNPIRSNRNSRNQIRIAAVNIPMRSVSQQNYEKSKTLTSMKNRTKNACSGYCRHASTFADSQQQAIEITMKDEHARIHETTLYVLALLVWTDKIKIQN